MQVQLHRATGLTGLVSTLLLGLSLASAQAQGPTPRELFTAVAQPPCGLCHALSDAGTTGQIGPNLDELVLDEQKVRQALKSGVGAMPSYSNSLSSEQIDRLARYVVEAVGD